MAIRSQTRVDGLRNCAAKAPPKFPQAPLRGGMPAPVLRERVRANSKNAVQVGDFPPRRLAPHGFAPYPVPPLHGRLARGDDSGRLADRGGVSCRAGPAAKMRGYPNRAEVRPRNCAPQKSGEAGARRGLPPPRLALLRRTLPRWLQAKPTARRRRERRTDRWPMRTPKIAALHSGRQQRERVRRGGPRPLQPSHATGLFENF